MGMPVARLADICTGHHCYPPRPNVQGSENVFVNSRPHHRLGDAWAAHCCPGKGCHGSVTCTGSSTVFINSIPAARVGDLVCCSSSIMTGSFNVFEGG
jgi:uncharacterized Zn-binding protein involved in type VI secretion